MKKEFTARAIELTLKVLTDFYQLNPETVCSLSEESVTWIGAQKEQFIIGKQALKKELDLVVAEMIPCHLENEMFMITENEGNTCTVIGRYIVISDENPSGMAAGEQRCVVIWKLKDRELRILHISTTSPIGEVYVTDDEHFVRSMSSTMRNFFYRSLDSETVRLLFTERGTGNMFTLSARSILYCEAQKKHCLLVTAEQSVEILESISEVKEKTADIKMFLAIGRSFLINISHIRKITTEAAVMTDGTEIRFPERKRAQIREELREKYR